MATRHTLPNIQTSLSPRRFSMVKGMKRCPRDPAAVHLHGLCFLMWPQMAASEALAGGGVGVGAQRSVAVSPTLILSLSANAATLSLRCQVTCLPSQPFTLQPASSLPPSPGPKRRGRQSVRREADRWRWVAGVLLPECRIRCLLLLLVC